MGEVAVVDRSPVVEVAGKYFRVHEDVPVASEAPASAFVDRTAVPSLPSLTLLCGGHRGSGSRVENFLRGVFRAEPFGAPAHWRSARPLPVIGWLQTAPRSKTTSPTRISCGVDALAASNVAAVAQAVRVTDHTAAEVALEWALYLVQLRDVRLLLVEILATGGKAADVARLK